MTNKQKLLIIACTILAFGLFILFLAKMAVAGGIIIAIAIVLFLLHSMIIEQYTPVRCPSCGSRHYTALTKGSKKINTKKGMIKFLPMRNQCLDCDYEWLNADISDY